jgi:decaprenylphospho-beta-D-erythro-pentofuranosid-2-ulose 2-reductase
MTPALRRTAVILRGNSDIAHAVVTALAVHGLERVVLATRNPDALHQRLIAAPLGVTDLTVVPWDANDHTHHETLLANSAHRFGDIDLVVCAVGTLGHASGLSATPSSVHDMASDNFTGPATALTAAVSYLIAQGHGTIVVIGSVDGLRPRHSNYVYGSAKAALDAFTRGLQDATTNSGIHIIRPGFVTTKMTTGSHLHRSPPGPRASLQRSSGQSTHPTPIWRLLSVNR